MRLGEEGRDRFLGEGIRDDEVAITREVANCSFVRPWEAEGGSGEVREGAIVLLLLF